MVTFTIDSENNIAAHAEVPASADNLQTFASEKELGSGVTGEHGIIWVAGRCRLAEQRLHGVLPARAAEQGNAQQDTEYDQHQSPPVHRVNPPA